MGVEVDGSGVDSGTDDAVAVGVEVDDSGVGSGTDEPVGVNVDDGDPGSGVEQLVAITAATIEKTATSCFVDIAFSWRDSNATLSVSYSLRQALWKEG